jgi:hypothetical protein
VFFLVRALGGTLTAPPAPAGASPVGQASLGHINVVLHVAATLAAVIALGSLLSRWLRHVGQPPVIGEVIAGILLGPSLLGALSPGAANLLIPSAGMDPQGHVNEALNAVSQLGVNATPSELHSGGRDCHGTVSGRQPRAIAFAQMVG